MLILGILFFVGWLVGLVFGFIAGIVYTRSRYEEELQYWKYRAQDKIE